MTLAVDRRKPRWLVHVGHGDNEMTWPFERRQEAEAAYRLAVDSGQFRQVLRPATRTRPEFAVTLVSLWKREHEVVRDGKRHTHYVEVEVP